MRLIVLVIMVIMVATVFIDVLMGEAPHYAGAITVMLLGIYTELVIRRE